MKKNGFDIHLKIRLMATGIGFFLVFMVGTQMWLYFTKAAALKANLVVDVSKPLDLIDYNWKAVAQGGEQAGTRMLQNVVPQLSDLHVRYIRLDHIYDFYNVVSRSNGQLVFNWNELDATVCDIYASGAKPFFALGYMPPAISKDGSVISSPTNWQDWSFLIQKTIERYSGASTVLCGGRVRGTMLADVYYEVWNEPDHEAFGKWSLYGGEKDYKTLYYYTAKAAMQAQNVQTFKLGGPVTTAPYKNWFQLFLQYVKDNNLRLDFISWHRYTTNPDDYFADLKDIHDWLADPNFEQFRTLPMVISEWGYDSNYNPADDTKLGAAYTVAAIRRFIDMKLNLAVTFEAKDGASPSWGILTNSGEKKPRYYALQMLNSLDNALLNVDGEGTYVQSIATIGNNGLTMVISNYDPTGKNTELVPVHIEKLAPGTFQLTISNLYGPVSSEDITVTDGKIDKRVLMSPNMVVLLQLKKK